MNKRLTRQDFLKASGCALAGTYVLGLTGCKGGGGQSASKNYTIGWSTIYLTPSWMQETNKMLLNDADQWKKKGVLNQLKVANANG
ncbi:MAG: hypothetical protein ACR2KZ_17700, partial [Segetibacter sp.]